MLFILTGRTMLLRKILQIWISTLSHNVFKDIALSRVFSVVRMQQLRDFLRSLPDGYVQLSSQSMHATQVLNSQLLKNVSRDTLKKVECFNGNR